MTIIYLTAITNNFFYIPQGSLILPLSSKVLHNHLGDLWAITLVAISYLVFMKKQKLYLLLIAIGFILIGLSLSRSAILSIVVGIGYIFHNSPPNKNYKHAFIVIGALCLLLFLYFGIYKTTLFSRPYFLEGFTSLVNTPLGIGVGNFDQVSSESSLAHNILIEMVTGMGIFSVVFILWLGKVFKSFLKKDTNILYEAIFIAIFVNFCFDTTYNIPSMVWLWFSTLALILI
jgi:hypothetical protein